MDGPARFLPTKIGMKVAFFTNIIPPYREPLFAEIGKQCELHMVLSARREKNRLWQPADAAKEFHVHVLPGFQVRWKNRIFHWNHNIGKTIAAIRPDAVICSSFPPATVLAAAYCRKHGIPYFIWSEATRRSERNASKLRLRLRKELVKHSTGVIAVGVESREYLRLLGADAGSTHVAVDAVPPPSARTKVGRRELLQKIPGGIKILYAGNLSREKGVPQLLAVFKKLQRYRDVSLILLGAGELEHTIARKIEAGELTNVILAGFQPESTKWKYFQAADMFVFPTLCDVWGMVVNEAMMAGTAVICSCFAGAAADLVQDGETGLICNPLFHDDLERKIIQLIESPSLRSRLARAAAQRISQYTIDRSAVGFIDALRRAHGE